MKEFIKISVILLLSIAILGLTTVNDISATEAVETSNSIIEGGTIVTEESVSTSTFTLPSYTIESTSSRTEVAPYSNNPEVEGQSTYIDPVKYEANAGESYIVFNDETKYIEYNENGVVNMSNDISTQTTSAKNDYFIVENNVIVEASTANVITLGGADYTAYMYLTLEDAAAGVNGIPIAGNATDGHYYGTVEQNGKKYAEIEIAGFHGYMNLYDVQIIPSCIDMSSSYYFAEDGVWYYAIATDPLTSTQYEIWPISDAPEWAIEGEKYYSSDQESFYTSEYTGVNTTTDYQNAAYFQNLSFRSTTSYSGAQLQSFLKHKGYTNSDYYNATNAFVDKQEYFGVNGLLMFAHANLESAYGTSHYSDLCNNFFGRGAYDSNPDNACISFGYPTPQDGIYAEAIFYNVNYLDPGYYSMDKGYSYYAGSYVGNKSGGMNVFYATDGNWGSKIGSIAYECDKYLGGADNNKYRIIELTQEAYVYTDSSLANHVYTQGDYTYYPSDSNHNNAGYYGFTQPDVGNPKVVVVGETSNAYKVQIEAPVNHGSSGYETFTTAEKGSYPNYNEVLGGSSNYVKSGYVNFANEYESMASQQYWIPKTGTSVIAANPITNTSVSNEPTYGNCTTTVSTTYDDAGNKIVSSEAKDGSKVCITTYKGTSSTKLKYEEKRYSGNVKKEHLYYTYSNNIVQTREWYKYNDSGTKYYYSDMTYKNGKYSKCKEYYYDSKGVRTQRNEILYETDGSMYNNTKYYYNSKNQLTRKEIYKYASAGWKTYYCNAYYYTSTGKIKESYEYYYNKSGQRTQRNELKFESDGSLYLKQYFYYNSSNIMYKKETWKYKSSGKKYYYVVNQYNYYNGKSLNYFEYYYDDKGNRTQRNERYYDSNGSGGCKKMYYYNTKNTLIDSDVIYY